MAKFTVLAEKTLQFKGASKGGGYDVLTATIGGGNGKKAFDERHYLPAGTIPDGVTEVKVRYYIEVNNNEKAE